MTDGRPVGRTGQRRKKKGAFSSAVVAAATVGVTGLTLQWAVETTPAAPTPAATLSATRASQQLAADIQAVSRLRQSIAATSQQLEALGRRVPGSTKNTTRPGAIPATEAASAAGGAATSGAASVNPGAYPSPGSPTVSPTPAPVSTPTPSVPAPTPTPVTTAAPTPTTVVTTPPPVTTTTGASSAKP